ncbi:hypothetical protein EDC04DRAFT_2601275 [Pisolithus marmoratus]|nr:hypothetical protein EDC04DRAFT_2601275 [Pisolithus marmoratus]
MPVKDQSYNIVFGQSLMAHRALFSLLHLASIPAALRCKKDWSHLAMDSMVNNDTCETHWQLSESDSQKVLDLLFPDEVVFGPISMGELFKNKPNIFSMEDVFKNFVEKGLYNKAELCWTGVPNLSATAITGYENSLADFFNSVIRCISLACGTVRPGRTWTADLAMCPLAGGGAVRKPDMACWLAPGNKFDWRHLATFTELQHQCPTCDFVHILIGVTTASNEILGFNTSIAWEWQQCNSKAVGVKSLDIHAGSIDLAIELNRVLFISNNLFGQGTTVWGGMIRNMQAKTREPVVMKDLWIDPLWKYTEGRILSILNMHKIKGVPTLISNVNSLVNSSTYLQVLSHIVTQPIGDLITEFSCLGKLLIAFLDYVVAHKNAVRVAQILHCDTSFFNLFLASMTQRSDHKELCGKDLSRDHNIVLAMGSQSKIESDLCQMIDMSSLYCTSGNPTEQTLLGNVVVDVGTTCDGSCRAVYTHDMFIANIIKTLSHLGPDTWVPVMQDNNNKDYSDPEMKVKDELDKDESVNVANPPLIP